MKEITSFFIAIMTSNLLAANIKNCSKLKDDCEYYLCVAENKHCDEKSYPVKFGHRYCMRYAEKMSTFSSEGKTWVDEVRRCLIKEMNGFKSQLTCSELEQAAFDSHVPCYMQTGFCSLSVKDKAAVMNTIWPTLQNGGVWTSGMAVLQQCL